MQHAPVRLTAFDSCSEFITVQCGTRIVIPEFDAIIASDPYLTCEVLNLFIPSHH